MDCCIQRVTRRCGDTLISALQEEVCACEGRGIKDMGESVVGLVFPAGVLPPAGVEFDRTEHQVPLRIIRESARSRRTPSFTFEGV